MTVKLTVDIKTDITIGIIVPSIEYNINQVIGHERMVIAMHNRYVIIVKLIKELATNFIEN